MDQSKQSTQETESPTTCSASAVIAQQWEQAEARLREYESVVEDLREMIAVVDRDYRYLSANKAFLKQRGVRPEVVIGHQISEVLDPTMFENVIKPRLDEAFAGHVVRYELKYNYPDLGPRDLAISYFPMDGPGGVDRVACVLQDITERRRTEDALRAAERKYRAIFENAGEGIFQSTPEGRFIAANPALAKMYGYETPQELIRECNDISQIYADPNHRLEFMHRMEAGGLIRWFETQVFRKDGTKIWIMTNARAVRDDFGKVLYYEGTAQDITDRKRAEMTSCAFATLARKLSGARTQIEAGLIIAETAKELFGWDLCNLNLYDPDRDLIVAMLNVDTINGEAVDVTPKTGQRPPTPMCRRVIDNGPQLVLREQPVKFDTDSVPYGDVTQPSAAIMGVPIRHASNIIGVLLIHSYALRAYDQAALKDFESLADHCGEALNRIQAEESLRESEERYRDLVENSHELICTHDLDGKILSANRAAVRLLGYDLKAFVGKRNIRDILAPEFRDQFAEYMARLQKNGATSGLMVVQTNSGEQRVWEYYNSLRTDGVATPIVRGMARDITERRRAAKALRESEERYRELFENSKDAIYIHDLHGRYTSVNRAAEELTGYSREEIVGKHYSNFIGPRFLKEARENFCLKFDVSIETTYEAEVVRRDGKRIPVEVTSRMIHKDGVVIGVQGTVRDITERKRAEDVLQTYSRRLLEAQEIERQKISRELHDEIGQVLTAIRLNLQAVQESCETDACLPRIDESISVIDEALNQVRELSLELRPSLLDELGLVAALRWYAARYTLRSGIDSAVTCNSEIKGIPYEVGTACFRIAQEALTNSARHSKATKATVRVERRNGELHLSIQDNGVGFDSHLFLNGMASSALGLRGMQERALAVSGRVQINSQIGKGTDITVVVPLKL